MRTDKRNMEVMNIGPSSSSYSGLGSSYAVSGHKIAYAPSLTLTGKNYYDSKREVQGGDRMSTAAEELAFQLAAEREGEDPKNADIFHNLFDGFVDDDGKVEAYHAWQWTETGLRVPQGWGNGRYDSGAQGYPRIVLIGNKEIAEIVVPHGKGNVVDEWDEVFGIPKKTVPRLQLPDSGYVTKFWFNQNPERDPISGKHDIAVVRRAFMPESEEHGCLMIDATYRRSFDTDGSSFRQVRGALPQTEKQKISA